MTVAPNFALSPDNATSEIPRNIRFFSYLLWSIPGSDDASTDEYGMGRTVFAVECCSFLTGGFGVTVPCNSVNGIMDARTIGTYLGKAWGMTRDPGVVHMLAFCR